MTRDQNFPDEDGGCMLYWLREVSAVPLVSWRRCTCVAKVLLIVGGDGPAGP